MYRAQNASYAFPYSLLINCIILVASRDLNTFVVGYDG